VPRNRAPLALFPVISRIDGTASVLFLIVFPCHEPTATTVFQRAVCSSTAYPDSRRPADRGAASVLSA